MQTLRLYVYKSGVMADQSFTLRECAFVTFFAPVTFMYELDPHSHISLVLIVTVARIIIVTHTGKHARPYISR